MNEQDLAHKVGITAQQLRKYEAGQNRVSAALLYRLAEELGVPLTWFFKNATGQRAAAASPKQRIGSAPQELSANDDIIHLLTYYQRVRDPEVRRILVSLARYLSSEPSGE
jgi:transcriptional regulator with XRE-family HTH domain